MSYSKGSGEMENRDFVKLIKDHHMICKELTTTDLDICFSKYKDKGGKKIHFDNFEHAIEELAKKKKISKEAFVAKLTSGS
mmetsp:Transcript_119302/g.178228  ORF Transcript_119302/g.178228 Transcript_119302/m.178228 type:complete len:81 (+) Transcript_119302:134-376(+)